MVADGAVTGNPSTNYRCLPRPPKVWYHGFPADRSYASEPLCAAASADLKDSERQRHPVGIRAIQG